MSRFTKHRSLYLLTALILPLVAHAHVLVTDPVRGERLMTAVENALWVPDGTAADRPVYVIYSTQCGFSRQLFERTRAANPGLQLRWIAAAALGADQVVSVRDTATMAAAFAGAAGRPADPGFGARGVAYNYAVMNGANHHLRQFGRGQSFQFPTLIYRTAAGVRIVIGMPDDLSGIAREILAQPERTSLQPAGLDLVREPVKTERVARLSHFSNDGSTPIAVHAWPSDLAPMLDELASGYRIPASGVVPGTGWIEVQPWGPSGVKAYVHAPLEVRLLQLEFQVKRATGHVAASRGALQVHSHPDLEAPVIDTVEQGYQVRKSGEVTLNGRTWDEVMPFASDTRGYVLRR
jgi:hypothetical protein